MERAVNHYYVRHAEAVGALVAPVGRAWERASRDPELKLHTADGSHPNERGTYLAACVLYATLTNRSPVGLGSGDLAITVEERARLQHVAWDTRRARQRSASPEIGAWPLGAGGDGHDLLAKSELTLGGVAGPGGALPAATQFGAGKYAVIPYFAGLNAPSITIAFHAYRSDWTLPPAGPEMLVAKSWAYEVQQVGLTLEARIFTDGVPASLVTVPVSGLASGWHRFALTYDGARHALFVDARAVASATTSGALRYYESVPDERRYDPLALGVRTRGTEPEAATFTGALSGVRLFDTALAQTELEKL
jgi:hypothetical protein